VGLAARVQPALDDLDAIQVGADHVAQGVDHEGGRVAAVVGAQVVAHRHAFLIAPEGRLAAVHVFRCVVPTAEEAHHDPGAGGAIDLLALHRVPDGGAGVLLGPDRGVAGGHELIALEHAVLGLGEGVVHALG
jgi:hypothetical protein